MLNLGLGPPSSIKVWSPAVMGRAAVMCAMQRSEPLTRVVCMELIYIPVGLNLWLLGGKWCRSSSETVERTDRWIDRYRVTDVALFAFPAELKQLAFDNFTVCNSDMSPWSDTAVTAGRSELYWFPYSCKMHFFAFTLDDAINGMDHKQCCGIRCRKMNAVTDIEEPC